MSETLLSQSSILLYGRVLSDIIMNPKPYQYEDRIGQNLFLKRQLTEGKPDDKIKLARIYAFTYEGHYYDLGKPVIFLVSGKGEDPDSIPPGDYERLSRGPDRVEVTGVAKQAGSFSQGMRVWEYDKGDFSIRLDVETGPLSSILLEAELRSDRLQSHYSGDRARARRPGKPSD